MFSTFSPHALDIKVSFRESARLARLGKFEGIDITWDDHLLNNGSSYIQSILATEGLKAGGWELPFNWYQEDISEQKSMLEQYASIASAVGANRCYTLVRPGSNEYTFSENFSFHLKKLSPIAEILAAHGCRLGLGFVGTPSSKKIFSFPFISTLSEMQELSETIGHSSGILLDSFHWHMSLGTEADISHSSKELFVYVQVSDCLAGFSRENHPDNQRALPGETGIIDFKSFFKGLQQCGYNGPITPTPFNARISAMMTEPAVCLTAGYLLSLLSPEKALS